MSKGPNLRDVMQDYVLDQRRREETADILRKAEEQRRQRFGYLETATSTGQNIAAKFYGTTAGYVSGRDATGRVLGGDTIAELNKFRDAMTQMGKTLSELTGTIRTLGQISLQTGRHLQNQAKNMMGFANTTGMDPMMVAQVGGQMMRTGNYGAGFMNRMVGMGYLGNYQNNAYAGELFSTTGSLLQQSQAMGFMGGEMSTLKFGAGIGGVAQSMGFMQGSKLVPNMDAARTHVSMGMNFMQGDLGLALIKMSNPEMSFWDIKKAQQSRDPKILKALYSKLPAHLVALMGGGLFAAADAGANEAFLNNYDRESFAMGRLNMSGDPFSQSAVSGINRISADPDAEAVAVGAARMGAQLGGSSLPGAVMKDMALPIAGGIATTGIGALFNYGFSKTMAGGAKTSGGLMTGGDPKATPGTAGATATNTPRNLGSNFARGALGALGGATTGFTIGSAYGVPAGILAGAATGALGGIGGGPLGIGIGALIGAIGGGIGGNMRSGGSGSAPSGRTPEETLIKIEENTRKLAEKDTISVSSAGGTVGPSFNKDGGVGDVSDVGDLRFAANGMAIPVEKRNNVARMRRFVSANTHILKAMGLPTSINSDLRAYNAMGVIKSKHGDGNAIDFSGASTEEALKPAAAMLNQISRDQNLGITAEVHWNRNPDGSQKAGYHIHAFYALENAARELSRATSNLNKR